MFGRITARGLALVLVSLPLVIGVPAVAVQPLYTQGEMWKYGVAQGTEVRLPIFKATF